MRPRFLLLGLSLLLGLPAQGVAQTDFLTAKKIACVGDRMTRCKAVGGECETRAATAGDRAQPLVVDFEAKRAFIRREGEERTMGLVLEDKVEGDTRNFILGRSESRDPEDTMIFKLRKDGKMDGTRDAGRTRMEATCAPTN